MTKTEHSIVELQKVIEAQKTVAEHLRRDTDILQSEVRDLRNLTKPLEELLRTTRDDLIRLQVRYEEHLKSYDRWDNRRWAIIGLFFGALLTLTVNIVVIMMRK